MDVDGAHNWRRVDVGDPNGWQMSGVVSVDGGHRYAAVAMQSRSGSTYQPATYNGLHQAMAMPAVDATADVGLAVDYDAEGHPVRMAAESRSLEVVYDAFGRRALEIDERGERTYFVWDQDEVLALGHQAAVSSDVFFVSAAGCGCCDR